jgi:hypothetical protein
MYNTPSSGVDLLEYTKAVWRRAQATRTAEAVQRYLTSSDTNNDCDYSESNQDFAQGHSAGNGELWERHDSRNSSDIIFTRCGGETITISKSPGSDRWLIVYDEPIDLPA